MDADRRLGEASRGGGGGAQNEARDESVAAGPVAVLKELVAGRGPPLRVLLLAMVIEFAGYAMLIPVLPFFLMHELGLGASEVGILFSSFSLAQLIGAWAGGRVSDAVGRYPVMVAVFTWAGVGMGLTAFVRSFWEVMLVRVAQGMSGGTAALCDAYVLDVVSERNRAAYVGLVNAVKGVSFMFGPALSGLLIHLGVARRSIFLVAGSCGLLSALICFLFLEESLAKAKRRPLVQSCIENGKANSDNAEFEAVNKGLICVWYCRFASAMGLGFIYSTYAFLIKDNFGWGDAQFALVLLCSGILTASMQFVVFPQLARRFGAAAVLGLGCASAVIALTFMPEPILTLHLITIVFFAASGACVEPSLPVLIGEFVSNRYLGFANGGTTSFRALATVLTPLIAGRVYELSARHAYYSGAACFAFATLGVFPILFPSAEEKALLSSSQKIPV